MGSCVEQIRERYEQLGGITAELAASAAGEADPATLRSLLGDRTKLIKELERLLEQAHRWVREAPGEAARAEQADLDAAVAAARAIQAQDAGTHSIMEEALDALRGKSAALHQGRRTLRSYRPARESDSVIDRQG